MSDDALALPDDLRPVARPSVLPENPTGLHLTGDLRRCMAPNALLCDASALDQLMTRAVLADFHSPHQHVPLIRTQTFGRSADIFDVIVLDLTDPGGPWLMAVGSKAALLADPACLQVQSRWRRMGGRPLQVVTPEVLHAMRTLPRMVSSIWAG